MEQGGRRKGERGRKDGVWTQEPQVVIVGGNRMSVDGVDGARGRQQGDWELNVARKRQQGERMLNGARGLLASERSLLNFPLPKNIFCRKESCALSDARL